MNRARNGRAWYEVGQMETVIASLIIPNTERELEWKSQFQK